MNRTLRTYGANLNITSVEENQSAPIVPSFTNNNADWSNKSTFYPDYGATGNEFTSNIGYSEISNNYIFKAGGIWNSDRDDGFIIEKHTDQMVEFNLRFYGSPGHFIPAPMLKGFSFQEYYATAVNSNWRVRRLALEFRNWDTGSYRIYAPDWNNGAQAQVKNVFRNMSAQNHWNVIRSWGPEWAFHGAIFNVKSNSTNAVQRPKMHIYSARVAWQTTGLTGTTKWVPTKYQSWPNFSSQMRTGTLEFQTG